MRHARREDQQRRALVGRRDLLPADLPAEEGRGGEGRDEGRERPAGRGAVEAVDQRQDRQVLQRQEAGLSKGREGQAVRDAVGRSDAVGGLLELGRERGEARGGAGGGELEELRELDDRGAGDDAIAEALFFFFFFFFGLRWGFFLGFWGGERFESGFP